MTDDFEPGGNHVYFADMDDHCRRAVERAINQLNFGTPDPQQPIADLEKRVTYTLVDVWALQGAGGWDNVGRLAL